MTTTAAFITALDGLHDLDPERSQQIWTAYRVLQALMTHTENETILTFLRGELDELLDDVTARYPDK